MIDRRETLKVLGAGMIGAASAPALAAIAPGTAGIRWWSTTSEAAWQPVTGLVPQPATNSFYARDVNFGPPAQTMRGFGGAFSELGWQALRALPGPARQAALNALFGDDGAAFAFCRTPIGANDFARKWYSYNETADDFALRDFSIANDRETLIPFIKSAQAIRPGLKLWASPWSPPTWMKTGRHYAQAAAWPGSAPNGITPAQFGHEGKDSFIQDDRYFDAYARYFRRYVEAYAAEGIAIGTVMPQNEFNSAQPFPSCVWTPEGLARFLPFLTREMDAVGVDVFFGTLERANAQLLTPALAAQVKGVGVQWAGKDALAGIRARYPAMEIWATEQECGMGTNDWHYARYGWDLMKRYLNAGASLWEYWNLALPEPGLSTWGWPQNALISVDVAGGRYRLNPDYWVIRHLASHVRPGARFIPTSSMNGFDNQLAFRNPDGSLVIVIHNEMAQPQPVRLMLGSQELYPRLPASSFNTIVVPAG
jgi:glucosylceramidase